MNFWILTFYTLALTTIISCKTQVIEQPSNTEVIELVFSLKKSVCSGECPAFQFELYDDQSIKYKGIRFVEHIGSYEGRADDKFYESLITQLNTAQLQKFESSYKKRQMLDLPTTTLTYKTKRIEYQFSEAPESIKKLTADLIELIDTIELTSTLNQ